MRGTITREGRRRRRSPRAPLSSLRSKGSSPANGAFVRTRPWGPARRPATQAGKTFESVPDLEGVRMAARLGRLCIFIVAALALDLRAGFARARSPRWAPRRGWSIVWTALGIAFAAVVLAIDGGQLRERVPRGLPDREVALARQPVRLRGAVHVLRRARGPAPAGARLRDRGRDRAAHGFIVGGRPPGHVPSGHLRARRAARADGLAGRAPRGEEIDPSRPAAMRLLRRAVPLSRTTTATGC